MKTLISFLAEHAVEVVQSIGIIGGLFYTACGFRDDVRSRRVANLLLLTQHHRDIWTEILKRPALARVLDTTVDVEMNPVTPQEERFVLFVVSHLNAVLEAGRQEEVGWSDAIARDVGDFFRLPIPAAVWKTKRRFQDKQLVEFIEASLSLGAI